MQSIAKFVTISQRFVANLTWLLTMSQFLAPSFFTHLPDLGTKTNQFQIQAASFAPDRRR